MKSKFATHLRFLPPLFLLYLFLSQQACVDSPLATDTTAVLNGRVLNSKTSEPVEDVHVHSGMFTASTYTDASGKYSLVTEIEDSVTVVVQLIYTKDGFEEDSLFVAVKNGDVTQVPEITLTPKSGSQTGSSGPAANVVMVQAQHKQVYVKHSGSNETSDLTFEVRDAEGVPIDRDHLVTVQFRITSGPGGGEYLSPDTVQTDNEGIAVTTLNSGTRAGTVQITAEVRGTSIHSEPVPIAINGAAPDQDHFTIGVEMRNFAGLVTAGLTNTITAYVGDKYSNPVPPGTVIQFFSTGGIIEGSEGTNEQGIISRTLISGNPSPPGVNFSQLKVLNPSSLPAYFQEPGYALITAETQNENNQPIYAENIVLFSGYTQIAEVTPQTFDLGPDSSVSISFRVSDENLNPLVGGTQISVSTNNGSVTGDTDVTLDDTRSRAATRFVVVLSNSKPDDIEGTATTVEINVGSANGNAKFNIFGTMRKSGATGQGF